MRIKSLSISNFLVIGSAEINLDSRGLVLVQGINDTDSSANSNGAGKSSIVDAISWCLYGETARGETGDAVINNQIGKDCFVKVVIDDEGHEYAIERYRKHRDHKNNLEVHDMESGACLTKGTTGLTQVFINKLIGCSYEVFIAAVYSGQEQMPDLPGMTDKQLKLIVEEAAGIERLQNAHNIALVKAKAAKEIVDGIQMRIELNQGAICRAQDEKERLVTNEYEWQSQKSNELNELNKKLDGLRKELEIAKAAPGFMSSAEIRAVESELAGIKNQIEDAQGEEKKQLGKLDNEVIRLEREVAAHDANAKSAHKEAQIAKRELDGVDERVGTPCSECGKEYCKDDMADARANAEKKLKSALLKLRDAKRVAEDATNALNSALEARKKFINSMTDISALLQRSDDLQQNLRRHQEAVSRANEIVADIRELQSSIETSKQQIKEGKYGLLIEVKMKEIDRIENEVKSLTTDLHIAEEKLSVAEKAAEVFGRSGVRAHILDTVTPFLNERTAEYLGTLTDGNITATWSTLGATAKGELREKFGIAVEKATGAKSFRGLSGGEKKKVRLATALALGDLVASRATKPIDFQLWDEIDDALDASGLERLMTILDRRSREKGTILVISHNDLASFIDTSITVKNTGGISEVIDE